MSRGPTGKNFLDESQQQDLLKDESFDVEDDLVEQPSRRQQYTKRQHSKNNLSHKEGGSASKYIPMDAK